MDQLPDDIRERIRAVFPDDTSVVESLLAELQSPRVIRSVLHLAGRDLERLRHLHAAARRDWRDVIWWAEYDHPENPEARIHDFNRPFAPSTDV